MKRYDEDDREDEWNNQRVKLQVECLEAINALSDHMGCGDIALPYGHGNWHIKHIVNEG